MSIRSQFELKKLKAIGRIVRMALDAMAAAVRPGITTAELDRICADLLATQGAEPSPSKFYGFPGAACISVNDEAIHGIPGGRRLFEGDLVKLDVTAGKDGFIADAAITVRVGIVSQIADALTRCAEDALQHALKTAVAGRRIYDIGRAVEQEVRRCGFSVIKEFCGHGVGRAIHEEPCVPNHFDPRYGSKLKRGLVITIEPIISAGDGSALLQSDRWTIRTGDRALAAHFEHTLVITESDPILLTAA